MRQLNFNKNISLKISDQVRQHLYALVPDKKLSRLIRMLLEAYINENLDEHA